MNTAIGIDNINHSKSMINSSQEMTKYFIANIKQFLFLI